MLRQEGARALVVRVASETCYRRLLLLEHDLREPLEVEVAPDLEFGFLDERHLDAHEALRPGTARQTAERLAAGHRCFGAWRDGRLVAVRWVATGSPHVEYLGLELRLAEGDVYHYDTFTDPGERRRGISLASQARLFDALRREGHRRAVRAVLPENRAAVADAARAAFRPRGRIGYVRLGRWHRAFRTDLN